MAGIPGAGNLGGLIGKGLWKGASKINKAAKNKEKKNKQEISDSNNFPQKPVLHALDPYLGDQRDLSPPEYPDPPRRTHG